MQLTIEPLFFIVKKIKTMTLNLTSDSSKSESIEIFDRLYTSCVLYTCFNMASLIKFLIKTNVNRTDNSTND